MPVRRVYALTSACCFTGSLNEALIITLHMISECFRSRFTPRSLCSVSLLCAEGLSPCSTSTASGLCVKPWGHLTRGENRETLCWFSCGINMENTVAWRPVMLSCFVVRDHSHTVADAPRRTANAHIRVQVAIWISYDEIVVVLSRRQVISVCRSLRLRPAY